MLLRGTSKVRVHEAIYRHRVLGGKKFIHILVFLLFFLRIVKLQLEHCLLSQSQTRRKLIHISVFSLCFPWDRKSVHCAAVCLVIMNELTNLWKFGINWSSNLQENNERKIILVALLCAFTCITKGFSWSLLQSLSEKLPLSKKLRYFRGNPTVYPIWLAERRSWGHIQICNINMVLIPLFKITLTTQAKSLKAFNIYMYSKKSFFVFIVVIKFQGENIQVCGLKPQWNL